MHKLSRVIFLDPLFTYFILSLQGLFYMEIWIPTAIDVRTHYVLLHYSTENRPNDKWLPTWLLQFLENLDVYPWSSYHYFSALDRKIYNIRFGSTCLTVKILLQKHCIYLFMSFKGLHLYFMFFVYVECCQ
jgi:hypothetical protein